MTQPLPWEVPGRIQGVDVSSIQARLSSSALDAASVHWVDVKASESIWPDHSFATHVADAHAGNRKAGGYHFLHSTDPWRQQADTYLNAISGVDLELRPCLDWEDAKRIVVYIPGTPRINWAATAENAKRAADNAFAWLDYVHAQTGRRPNIYTGKGFTDIFETSHVDLSPFLVYDLWQAHYRWDVKGHDYEIPGPYPIVLGGKVWTARAWQFCGNGGPRIGGIPFDLDRDVFYGDVTSFDAWCNDSTPTQPYLPPDPRTVLEPAASTIADEAHSIIASLSTDPDNTEDTPPTPTKPEAPRSRGSSQKFPAVTPPDVKDDEEKKT